MRKFMIIAAGAALLGGTLITTTQADARPGYRGGYGGGYGGGYRGYGGGYRRGGRGYGAAAGLGLAGALIGGAIAAQQPRYYGYGPGYGYAPTYYYRPAPTYYYGY